VRISRELAREVNRLAFSEPVVCVYNPLDYARAPHEQYLLRFARGRKKVVLLGMNPGPFGMAQTGVPFGDVRMVRDWLGIVAPVERPACEHPKRPIAGFDCHRSEVSGTRLWGWAKDRFGTPEQFFRSFFVANYCPLAFLEDSGRNRTPDKLPAAERDALTRACDKALRRLVEELEPKFVVGVGGFAEECARRVLPDHDFKIGCILHPSPASPKANNGWARTIEGQLQALGIDIG
jgi:single-strand selective monofunctional uracil DNA glycosylase